MNNFFNISFLSALLLFFLGCQTKSKFTDKDVFRYNEVRNITSLDPAFARNPQNIWPISQLFNSLVQLDDSLNVIPEIAKKWNITENGTRYTFILKDDVYFHSSPFFLDSISRKVRASDFVYSLNRLTDPKIASPGGWVMKNVENVEALNDSTLTIKLNKSFPPFLGLLSMRYCSVVPHEVVDTLREKFSTQPIGTGPFQFKKWKQDIKLVLRKNDHYFEKDSLGNPLPYLESIAINLIPDAQSEFILFLQQKLDLLNSIDTAYKDELLTTNGKLKEKYEEQIKLLKGPYLNTEYIGFYLDSEKKVVQSDLIREAFNIGFDRKKMITFLRNTIGIPANNGFIPKGLTGFDNRKLIIYNPEKSKQLIDSFIKINNTKPVLKLATDNNYLYICEYLQQELSKVGLSIEIDLMPTVILRQKKTTGKLEAFRASWIADYPDAENYLALFYSENFSPHGPNYTHFFSKEFDSLYLKSLEVSNIGIREKLYKQMNQIIVNKNPIIPLYYDEVTRFVQHNVYNFGVNPINSMNLKTVRKN